MKTMIVVQDKSPDDKWSVGLSFAGFGEYRYRKDRYYCKTPAAPAEFA
jgi:hypothetical protein